MTNNNGCYQSQQQRKFSAEGKDDLYQELWKLCAGPLVDVPKDGERVYYFLKLEASINQELNLRVPSFNLKPKILCRVIHINLLLSKIVMRKHANECLPPLDMNQQTPTQELIAKDLHGIEWHFKHIFRGQPRRHLLTTGWSTFVSSKRLVAGILCILGVRMENKELGSDGSAGSRAHNAIISDI
ncbi:hypothetical protein HAX54_008967 [Datura stramonium]|uniref:TF-B3 domain-containing protein n=1 Tax=Datura stramonium TaxID=4076 RepID=A0ABS8RY53_DATST|nr:hypothetical protein [Datura stramonium]